MRRFGAPKNGRTMEASLFRYIWQQTRREQAWILFVILASMPFNYLMLDLPKYIVNGPIQAKGFERATDTQHYFQVRVPVPPAINQQGFLELLHGFDLNRMSSLIVLSAAFLLLVIVNGLFKFYINTYKGRLGERMLQQLRYDLVDRVLRFPPSEHRRIKPAEIATMIKDEVEPLGGFIGDAFVQPFFLGGQIITALVFILTQNVMLGLIALGLLAVQGVVIPRMRRKQLVLGRQRQLTSRALAGRIGEIIDDMPNILTNDVSNYHRADVAARLTTIFGIRFALYQWKFFVKFLNNLLAQITPFLFYMVGGLLAIAGHLNIGQLVAVISAYKDLPSPVKDLIDWDQQRLDVEVKYTQVIEQFSVDPSLDLLPPPDFDGPIPHLEGEVALSAVTVIDTASSRLLDNLSVTLELGEFTAIDGNATSGGETLVEVLARLVTPDSGRVALAGRDLREWPSAITGRRISVVGAEPFFPQSTITDALLYGLRHRVLRPSGDVVRHKIIKSGTTSLDFAGDWVDYEAAGATGPEDINDRLQAVLTTVDLESDVVSFGLNRSLAEPSAAVQQAFVEARTSFRAKLDESGAVHLVEPFDPDLYNAQASIGENLVFGMPISEAYDLKRLGSNPELRKILADLKLDDSLYGMGRAIASTIMELFQGLEPDNPLFEQLSLMSPEDFPDYQAALKRVGSRPLKSAIAGDQAIFLDLAFNYIEPRDRLGLLDDALIERLVTARKAFHKALGEDQEKIAFFHPDRYIAAGTAKDNIVMGRVAFGIAEAEHRVNALLHDVIAERGLRPEVFEAGLAFNIGTAGKRLTGSQRQKLAMGRALLRRPDYLLVHRGLSQLDAAGQEAILGRVLALGRPMDGQGFGVLWNLENPRLGEHFDRVLHMEDGRVGRETRAPEPATSEESQHRETLKISA
ncbi:ABC transporter transmembrane domain-containing protein [Lichenihabitans sp. Uapishka_5]|uniref:ABC transporter transmembrane domain-containing protein n=1 Tax=Lichenihabitans sp. Uapishka_5 TaxID=3037302 RepID=UPI0029E7FA07|nr:ABC transporter transmembrane domain-containing protein [Lichenihabitans sp. Uapishka_5]MDX7950624.1 ABC transporter transmembrane domain-containing protein [Lichenihabitans sp. Uapishka_5]